MPTPRRGRAAAPTVTPAAPANPAPVRDLEPRPDAKAFQRAAQTGELFRLPGCGHLVRLRRPSLMDLAARGNVPNPFAAEVMKLIAADDNPAELTHDERIERYQRNARAFIEIAALCFVEPKMVLEGEPDYDAGQIAPSDIPTIDYVWLYYNYVEGVAEELLPFRA